ncbi:dihydroorotate dehydrogenase, partial [Streptococcus pneumoniae]
SWNGLMVEISPCCLDFIQKSVTQALFKLLIH